MFVHRHLTFRAPLNNQKCHKTPYLRYLYSQIRNLAIYIAVLRGVLANALRMANPVIHYRMSSMTELSWWKMTDDVNSDGTGSTVMARDQVIDDDLASTMCFNVKIYFF